jgi:hypothetical protein
MAEATGDPARRSGGAPRGTLGEPFRKRPLDVPRLAHNRRGRTAARRSARETGFRRARSVTRESVSSSTPNQSLAIQVRKRWALNAQRDLHVGRGERELPFSGAQEHAGEDLHAGRSSREAERLTRGIVSTKASLSTANAVALSIERRKRRSGVRECARKLITEQHARAAVAIERLNADGFLTAHQVAVELKVTDSTVSQWIIRGLLKAEGRIIEGPIRSSRGLSSTASTPRNGPAKTLLPSSSVTVRETRSARFGLEKIKATPPPSLR